MRNASERNTLAKIQIAGEQTLVALMSMDRTFRLLLHQALKFFDQAFVSFFIVRFVLQNDLAIAIDRDAIVGVRQIFGGEPEIE